MNIELKNKLLEWLTEKTSEINEGGWVTKKDEEMLAAIRELIIQSTPIVRTSSVKL